MRVRATFGIWTGRLDVLLIVAIWENALKRSSYGKSHLKIVFMILLEKEKKLHFGVYKSIIT